MARFIVRGLCGLLFIASLAVSGDVRGYDPASPWPCMRHDYLNTGRADDIRPSASAASGPPEIRIFQTGRPIFSTPVVGGDGVVYIGSADFYFYAINPDGSLKWKFRTNKLIDSAASLTADGLVLVPGGDGFLYALDQETGQERWRFEADNAKAGKVQMVNWFEGNVTVAPDGTILAGNDNFRLYALDPAGELLYEYAAGGMIWSAVPTDKEGRHFFCSLDMNCYGVDAKGKHLWKAGFWGIFSSSPAIGPNGTVYIACFDGSVYALDPATGKKLWRFKTGDHVYGSAAIATDGTLYIGSTDGTMYALLDKGDRALVKWAFDTLDPIRSSPVIDGDGNIYFGNSDGILYALNPDGSRRWSIDLTESDKNDINASMALGRTDVALAMQDGRIVQVPYNYCLHEATRTDSRCNLDPTEGIPADGAFLYWITPGGSSRRANDEHEVLPGAVITLRLLVREQGDNLMAGIEKDSLEVEVSPPFAHHVTVSMDHRFINVVPHGMMTPGGKYEVKVRGRYREQGMKLLGHIWLTGGERLGRFEGKAAFRVRESSGREFPEGKPVVLSHLSFYQPFIFPSVAQIGMDDMNFIVRPVEKLSPGVWSAWGMVAAPDADGVYRPEPGNRVTFPVRVEYHGDIIKLYSRNLEFDHAGDRIGMEYFLATGEMETPGRETLISQNTLYSEGKNMSMAGSFYKIPAFGTPLAGTVLIDVMELPSEPPAGFSVSAIRRSGRKVVVDYVNSSGLDAAQNNICVMLLDKKTREPLVLDYAKATKHLTGGSGEITRTEVEIPWGSAARGLSVVVFVNGVELGRGEI